MAGRKSKSEMWQASAVLSVRLTPAQANYLREAAGAKGLLVSTFLRQAALEKAAEVVDAIDPQRPPRGWLCQHASLTAAHLIGQPIFGCGCKPQPIMPEMATA